MSNVLIVEAENDATFIKAMVKYMNEQENNHFMINIDNREGNLDTVLKKIKNHESIYADCLESWKKCVEATNKKVRTQDFDKVWINNYLRYDTCTSKEKGDANAKCSYNEEGFKYIMENKSNIWNFEDPILENLKIFLALFETGT